jgi:predicted O-methyltransferase YrrM
LIPSPQPLDSRTAELAASLDAASSRLLGRRVSHLTPRYIVDRLAAVAYERRHPDAPWLTSEAVRLLGTLLRRQDSGVEWGSGRSTCWLASRSSYLISVESSAEWYERVRRVLDRRGLDNVDYRYVEVAREPSAASPLVDYVESALAGLAPASLDYALIDGLYRDECARRAVQYIKPGGLLILDNADRYIPYPTRSPDRLKTAPTARWKAFLDDVAHWRLIWTTNGVNDTAVWINAS